MFLLSEVNWDLNKEITLPSKRHERKHVSHYYAPDITSRQDNDTPTGQSAQIRKQSHSTEREATPTTTSGIHFAKDWKEQSSLRTWLMKFWYLKWTLSLYRCRDWEVSEILRKALFKRQQGPSTHWYGSRTTWRWWWSWEGGWSHKN